MKRLSVKRALSRFWSWGLILFVSAGCAAGPRVEPAPAPVPKLDYQAFQERSNELRRFDPGGRINRVNWGEDGKTLSFTRLGQRYSFDLLTRELTHVEEEDQPRRPPRRGARRPWPGRGRQYASEDSPDGQWQALCNTWNVTIAPIEADGDGEDDQAYQVDRGPIAVTLDGHRKFRYGTANWVYGEELDQNTAMWWSPDSRRLVFYEFDEREVEDFLLLGGLTDLRTDLRREGYSKAGEPNPTVGLLSYDLETDRITRIQTDGGEGDEWYIYNVRFTPDGSEVLFNRTNRHQNLLHVVAADLETGQSRIVVSETQPTWQENRPYMRFLDDGQRFIWETEKTGYRQFELRHLDGRLLNPLTGGDYPAESVEHIDEEAGVLFYTACGGEHPLNVHLYRVNLDGSDQRRLTWKKASHTVDVSPDGQWFTAQYETISIPPTTALYDTEGNFIATLAESDPVRIAEYGYPAGELFTFKAADGVTDIYGSLFKPRDFDPTKAYPLVIDVYGGPASRAVRNRYSVGNAACDLGFMVARIDNRGTSGRGKEFMGAVYQNLGIVDLQDQADGVRYLRQRRYIDGDRVGIYGHSYGGYMSQLAVLKYPDVFHVAAAGAGLAHWGNYDTIYTERYMRTPQENPEGFEGGSCLPYVDQLEGKLLILHGMVDDNVHPNNAWQLVQALQEAGKPFDIMFYANRGHGLGRHSNRMRWEYLFRHLIENPVNAD